MNKNLKLFSILLVALVIFISIILVIKNYPFYGQTKIEMILGQDTTLISQIAPEVRIKSEAGYQRILETPVYFNVRTMPWYSKVEVYITYKADSINFDGIGGQTAPGFNYHVQSAMVTRLIEDDWYKAVFKFDLKNIYELNNFRRFVIATSATEEGLGELRIKNIKVILFR